MPSLATTDRDEVDMNTWTIMHLELKPQAPEILSSPPKRVRSP